MNYWKKFNDWYDSKPKNPKLYLIIGIIFFAIQIFLSGLEEVLYLEKKSISRFIILLIPGLIGIIVLGRYLRSKYLEGSKKK